MQGTERLDACRAPGGGRKPIIPELEDTIFDWIIDRRIRYLAVSRKSIQEFAIGLASTDPVRTATSRLQHRGSETSCAAMN